MITLESLPAPPNAAQGREYLLADCYRPPPWQCSVGGIACDVLTQQANPPLKS